MIIGKEYIFDSSHTIKDHPKCGRIHGHTWTLTVMIDGEPDNDGFVMDFHKLNDAVRPIIAKVDHVHLNEVIPVKILTCETLAQFLLNKIRIAMMHTFNGRLGVRLQEGRGGWAEVWEE